MNLDALYHLYCEHRQVTTDSRKVAPGGLFFGLRGERFDGNQFAGEALNKGAAFAVVDDPSVIVSDRYLLVEDSLKTLQQLALYHRRQLEIPVIAITGSNGKTTTKELVSAVLSSHYPTFSTPGNLNNHIGVPLSLLAIPPGTEVAVIEMGANHQGEIAELCRLAEPTHGLITNIGKAHLEGFGGLEGVKKGKSELYRFLAGENGVIFVNRDEAFLEELSAPSKRRIFYYRTDDLLSEKHPYTANLLATQPFLKVAFLNEEGRVEVVESQLVGAYNFNNILTAIVLGKYFKVPGNKIRMAIEGYEARNNRSQVLKWRTGTIILDAYNANPSSMRRALENFGEMPAPAKVAILGDMLELGEYSDAEHESIARQARAMELFALALVGPAFGKAARQLGVLHFPDVAALQQWFRSQTFPDRTLFLIKGSRGMQLERVLEGGEID